MSAFDVAVLGGGIIGRALAFELARRRSGRIVVVDAGNLGGEASPVAAGFLPVASMRAADSPLLAAAVAALHLYPEFLAALREAGGVAPSLESPGCVQVAASEGAAEALRVRVGRRQAQGFEAEFVDGTRIVRVVPGIADRFAGAAVFAKEAQVDAVRLMTALLAAAAPLGVTQRRGRARLRPGPASEAELCIDGKPLAAATIVIAAGAWSAELAGELELDLPIVPARGEVIGVDCAGPPLPHALEHRVLILPRGDGRFWISGLRDARGSSQEGRDELLRRAAHVWPSLEHGVVTEHRRGLRPYCTLRHPLVCRAPGWSNVYLAAGHHRSGFLLAPLTARIVAAELRGEAPPPEAASFRWPYGSTG